MPACVQVFAREIGEMPMRTRHCIWETRLQNAHICAEPLLPTGDGKVETCYGQQIDA